MQVSDRPLLDARWALPGQLARAAGAADDKARTRRSPRDWAIDATFFLGATLFWMMGADTGMTVSAETETGLSITSPLVHDPSMLLDVIDPVVGALLCLSLWWRRRIPVILAIAAILASTFSITSAGAVIVILFSLAVHRPWPISVPLALLQVPATLIYNTVRPDDSMSFLATIVFGTLLVVAILAWGIAVRARRQLVLSLRSSAEQDRREHGLLLHDARRAERERIAREMHDVLAHRISLLSVHAGALEYRTQQAEAGTAPAPTAAEVHHAVSVIRENAHQALEELREVLSVLRTGDAPPELTDGSLEPDSSPENAARADGTAAPQPDISDLESLIAEARTAGQQVHLDIDAPGLDGTRPQLQRTIFRVVQEGLTNARKHAPSSLVNISLRGDAETGISLVLTNVVAMDAVESQIPGAGAGLAGLAERVAIDGGTLTHEIRAGAFRLCVRLPWRA